MQSAAQKRSAVERIIDGIELTAAGFLAAVTILTFAAVMSRYLLSYGIPDNYDISSLLLGILIFWGIAVASYRGDHITVDLLWSSVGPRAQRAIDVFADLVSLGAMIVLTYMVAYKVLDTYTADIRTFDMRTPTWPFFLAAWIGLGAAILLLFVRTIALIFGFKRYEPQRHTQAID